MHSNTKGSLGNITTGSGRRKALFKLSKLLKFSEHTDFSVPLAYDAAARLLLRSRAERGSKNNVVITAHLSVILAGGVISLLDFRCVTKITPLLSCGLVAVRKTYEAHKQTKKMPIYSPTPFSIFESFESKVF